MGESLGPTQLYRVYPNPVLPSLDFQVLRNHILSYPLLGGRSGGKHPVHPDLELSRFHHLTEREFTIL